MVKLVSQETAAVSGGFPTMPSATFLLVLCCVFMDPGFRRIDGGKRSDRNSESKLIITVFVQDHLIRLNWDKFIPKIV